MTCHSFRPECRRFGKRKNRQQYQCSQFRKVFMEPREYHLDGIYVPMEKAEKVLRLLVEGSIVSMVEPVTGVHTEQFSSSWVLLSRTASTSWLRRFAPSLSEEPMGF